MFRKMATLSLFFVSTLLATDFAVTSTDDTGPGTLRDALTQVADNDTITFDPNLSGTITLESSLPAITASIMITGPTNGAVTIDGGGEYGIFDVSSFSYISDLTLINSDSATEGGSLLLQDGGVVFMDRTTIAPCNGTSCLAPVHILANAALFTNNTTFTPPTTSGLHLRLEDQSAALISEDNTSTVWVASDSGESILYKEGDGRTEVKGVATIATQLASDHGTLVFSGTSTAPAFTLTNGVFEGTPTVDYLVNIGAASTGNGFGTMIMDTDFYQDARGTLSLKIDSSGNKDQIQGPGIGQIDGDLVLPLQPGTYTASSTYTLLSLDSGITGTFANVYFDIPGVGLQPISNATLNYNTNTIELEITSTFTVSSAHFVKHSAKKESYSPIAEIFRGVAKHKKKPNQEQMDLIRDYLNWLQDH